MEDIVWGFLIHKIHPAIEMGVTQQNSGAMYKSFTMRTMLRICVGKDDQEGFDLNQGFYLPI